MNPTREQVIEMARAAGAVEMRENCLNAEAFPWGCEMEIDHLLRFYAAARAQALDEAARKRTPGPRSLRPCGTGAFLEDQQYCFNKGFKEGQAAIRKAIQALKGKQ